MSSRVPHRRVLIVEGKSSVRNALYTLVARLGCHAEAAEDGQQALDLLQREAFDAILLDLRYANVHPEEVIPAIHSIRPSLVGNVLVITGEIVDPKVMELIDHYFVLQATAPQRMDDLIAWIRAFLRLDPLSQDI